jgi:hypothetical protein
MTTATKFDFQHDTHLPNGAEILRRKSNDGTRVGVIDRTDYVI